MSIIQPDFRLYDRHGDQWRTAPSYQDREVNKPGWLLMRRTSDGVEMPYSELLSMFGYGPPEARFLLGRFDDRARPASTAGEL